MLELKNCAMASGKAQLTYNVRHNVSTLRTVLEQDLTLEVDLMSGKVRGQLNVTDLEAENIDAARAKLATWCDRLSAALRSAKRSTGDLPLFEREPFDIDSHPLWLQQAFAQLVEAYAEATTDDELDAIKHWLSEHPLNLVPGMVENAQYAAALLTETEPEHPY